ncbi:MAG: imidazoleglycerol-phosphate dehydratase HisB, partial [Leuconostoc falkenbergense]
MTRQAMIKRETFETQIAVNLNL